MAVPQSASKKGLRIGRVLKLAAAPIIYPARVVAPRHFTLPTAPAPGEEPLVILRVQVLSCSNLISRDKNGLSDPFVVLSLAKRRFQTPVIRRSLNPIYNPKDSTFDFPIYLSLAEITGSLQIIIWDKNMLKKDYIGEIALPVEDWFKDSVLGFNDEKNAPIALNLESTRTKVPASGTITLKTGLVKAPGSGSESLEDIYAGILQRSEASTLSLLSTPPTHGIGTVRSRKDMPEDVDVTELEDDGMSTSEESGDESDTEGDISFTPTPPEPISEPPLPSHPVIVSPRPIKPPQSPSFLPRVFTPRLPRLTPQNISASTSTDPAALASPIDNLSAKPPTPSQSPPARSRSAIPGRRVRRPRFRRNRKDTDYSFSTGNDILGIVMLEIARAEDLPKLKNMTRTGWDMDPFVIVSFGKKVFRTRVIRHSLNPHWEEKLLFHVRSYEISYAADFVILDWDKFSSNDYVGHVSLPLAELMANAPHPDPKTGLYPEGLEKSGHMKEFTAPIITNKDLSGETKVSPRLTFRAQYQPYDALRQRFWRQYLKQYDPDEIGSISYLELRSMLDTLGSTLTRATVHDFFIRHGKNPETDDLTVDEAIQSLEEEVVRPPSEKKFVAAEDAPVTNTGALTPNINFPDFPTVDGRLGEMHYSGLDALHDDQQVTAASHRQTFPEHLQESNQLAWLGQYLSSNPSPNLLDPNNFFASRSHPSSLVPSASNSNSAGSSDNEGLSSSPIPRLSEPVVERVINIKTCPLCHRPRMNSKAELDIVTHLGVCASSDWNRVDRIVVGHYVTASQAQRKWYTNVISKVSSGAYQVGANSANIIVQNRLTGRLEEEKMQVYVRLGIRLLYKGASIRMEGARARRLLRSLSIKQGIKYDSPESVRDIPTFIAFHNLNVEEIREPLSSFKTFNQFFYRKLKEGARPISSPDDPSILVSGADCRMMAFETVSEATKLWIKGREFTVARLLGPSYTEDAPKYNGGALGIFRLAPQDYHRFHSPVDGTIGPMTYISGEYYTVNPQAVRTTLDVYGENARKIVPIDSPHFGRVYTVCVGAMMVGSIITTVNEGDHVARGDEFGYFAFGGSTIVLLFEKGIVEWDEDLLLNGRACLETLVRVGMTVGRSVRPPQA